jgi:hypothetical protein
MVFQPGANLYTQGFGSRPENVEVPHYDTRAPSSTDVLYPVGKEWVWINNSIYKLLGFSTSAGVTSANWVQISSSTGPVESVTGTANQILANPTTGNVVLSLIGPYTPATYTAHGVLIGEGTGSIVATSAGTAGQVLTSSGASADPTWTTATFPTTATAGALIAATATNVIGQITDVAVGQLLASGGVGVVPAYTGSPSVTGNVTAATGFVATTAGAGITLNSGSTSGTTTATLNGRSGQITITTPTINAGATFTMTIANTSITGSTTQVLYGLTGGTTGSAITIQSVTNSANQSQVVVQNASAVTNSTGSLVLTFLVLN